MGSGGHLDISHFELDRFVHETQEQRFTWGPWAQIRRSNQGEKSVMVGSYLNRPWPCSSRNGVNLLASYKQINKLRVANTQHSIQRVRLQLSSRGKVIMTRFTFDFPHFLSEIQDSTLNYATTTSCYIHCSSVTYRIFGVNGAVQFEKSDKLRTGL